MIDFLHANGYLSGAARGVLVKVEGEMMVVTKL